MTKRVVQILGFLISSMGWLFVLCTMAMDYWRIAQIGGTGGSFIIKVAWYWSNLWKDCFTDSAAVDSCRDFPVIWGVAGFVQGVRGLLMCGLTLGFFAVVLCFLGMECTFIGGAEKTKDKILFAGAVCHFVGGVADMAGYCLYINRVVRSSFVPPITVGSLRFELGPPILLGLVGCFLIFLGAVLYTMTVFRVFCPKSTVVYDSGGGGTYMAPRSRGRTLYTGYYKPSRQYGYYGGSRRSGSTYISKISQTTPTKNSERDAFV